MLFVLAACRAYSGFPCRRPHPTFSFLTRLIYFFNQTLSFSFSSARTTSATTWRGPADPNGTPAKLVARARHIRGAVSGQVYLNILLFLAQAILGGAVAARAVPRFLHGTLVVAAFVHFHYVMWREHLAFRDMTALVVEMTGHGRPDHPERADPAADG